MKGERLRIEAFSCHEGVVRLRAGSLLGHRRPKGEEEASSYTSLGTPRPAKGTAASTSSQPQAVMDSSADTSAPRLLVACGLDGWVPMFDSSADTSVSRLLVAYGGRARFRDSFLFS